MVPDPAQRAADDARHRRDAAARAARRRSTTFTKLIETAPDLSEAWNKRATGHWLLGNFPASLADICETVKREPRHFGAYSGLGMIRAEMGEHAARRRPPSSWPANTIRTSPASTTRSSGMKAMGGDTPADPLGCGQHVVVTETVSQAVAVLATRLRPANDAEIARLDQADRVPR